MNKFTIGLSASLALSLVCTQAAYAGHGQGAKPAQGLSQLASPLKMTIPSVVSRSTRVGHASPSKALHIAVSMPYADPEGMQAFVDSVSDPKSPNYRKFIAPEQVGERFGLPYARVQEVASYLNSKGFNITLVGKNRLSVLASGTVASAEAAFSTRIDEYRANNPSEAGNARFFSYSTPLKMPAALASDVLDVSGLESFTKPQRRTLTPTQTRVLYNLAPLYNSGRTGLGRSVAISNWDGFRLSNLPLYYAQYGLPAPVGGVGANVRVVTSSGGSGTGTPGAEGDLDIQMVLGMAPWRRLRPDRRSHQRSEREQGRHHQRELGMEPADLDARLGAQPAPLDERSGHHLHGRVGRQRHDHRAVLLPELRPGGSDGRRHRRHHDRHRRALHRERMERQRRRMEQQLGRL
jgi:hypothetical protein